MFLCCWAFNMTSLSNLRVKKLSLSSRFFFLQFILHAIFLHDDIVHHFLRWKFLIFGRPLILDTSWEFSRSFQCLYPIHVSIWLKYESMKKQIVIVCLFPTNKNSKNWILRNKYNFKDNFRILTEIFQLVSKMFKNGGRRQCSYVFEHWIWVVWTIWE